VLEITKQQKNEENYDPQIFRNILEQCEPHESCMKIFAHALYVNPKRSNEELNKLHKDLQASAKSFDIIAKKMFKFSYTDMPKEYKSCLLYLAIFPQRYKFRRSTLIGRWVAEGLISREDFFFLKVQRGGEDPHLVHSSEWPLTARCKGLAQLCAVG